MHTCTCTYTHVHAQTTNLQNIKIQNVKYFILNVFQLSDEMETKKTIEVFKISVL